jgi:flagellar biosynthesis GTPase FlhF
MKLYRFTAADSHKAIAKVHELLGPEALVYTTRKTLDGVEVLAGLSQPSDTKELLTDSISVQNAASDNQMIESLCNQVQVMDDNIQKLVNHINILHQFIDTKLEKKAWINWEKIKVILFKKRYFRNYVQFIKIRILKRQPAQLS